MNCNRVGRHGVACKLPVVAYQDPATWMGMMSTNAVPHKREEARLQQALKEKQEEFARKTREKLLGSCRRSSRYTSQVQELSVQTKLLC